MAIGAMSWASCNSDIEEYWTHVAAQEEMPLAGDERRHSALEKIEEKFPAGEPYNMSQTDEEELRNWIRVTPQAVQELRMLLSISDKRFYLDLSYRLSREHVDSTSRRTVCGCSPHEMRKHSTAFIVGLLRNKDGSIARRASEVIASYLVSKGALTILDLYAPLDLTTRKAVREKWLYPKEAQQNESKRRGHGAEAEVARILSEAGIPFIPANKATNPMGSADPNIDRQTFKVTQRDAATTFSADLVIPAPGLGVKVLLMGLVQSSDPGQFGVDKAATNRAIRADMDRFNKSSSSQIEMWGLIDGVGYSENVKGTLSPMLADFHHFIQHKSSYKVLLGAHRLGLCVVTGIRFNSDFYSDVTQGQMLAKYGMGISVVGDGDSPPSGSKEVAAGMATVWVRE